MDGIVLIRILRLGTKLSYVGIFNAIYLFPIYIAGCPDEDTEGYSDTCKDNRDMIGRSGLAHLSKQSINLYATTVAAYVLFGCALKFLFQEFKWFTKARHKFLSLPRPNNYTVYVAHIPEEYRSDTALLEYFQSIFGDEDVVDAKMARDIPILDSKVALRETSRTELESAMNVRNIKGKDPHHVLKTGQIVDSIPHYELQIQELDSEISSLFSRIDAVKLKEGEQYTEKRCRLSKIICQGTCPLTPLKEEKKSSIGLVEGGIISDVISLATASAKEGILYDMKDLTIDSARAPLHAAKGVYNLLKGAEEGSARDAGFVSFSRLWCKSQTLQTVHDQTPFTFEVENAPLPNYIYWKNVGLSHKKQQLGHFISTILWLALCTFWSLITGALSVLVGIEKLEKIYPGLRDESSNTVRTIVATLAPAVIVLAISIVPPILRIICRHEGHISVTALEASLYSKLSWFFIVQLFYLQAISGSILLQLKGIGDNPIIFFKDLGTSMPLQVGDFISLVLLKVFIQCIIELLRVGPLILSLFRKCFGPNLTEKESQRTCLGLSPLTVPRTLDYARTTSYIMLNFICLLVFSCIAPIMSFIQVFVFFLHRLTYRSQLIYTYSHENDSGGQFWGRFMKIMILLLLISEVTLFAIIISHGGYGPAVCLTPLLAVTFIFSRYLHKEHFRVTEHLPAILCMKKDLKNCDLDVSFVKGKYSQPALIEREIALDGDDSGKIRESEAHSISFDGDDSGKTRISETHSISLGGYDSWEIRNSEAHSTHDLNDRLLLSTSDNCVHPSGKLVSFRGDNVARNDVGELRESEVSNLYY